MTIARLNDTDETTLEDAIELGLAEDEHARALEILGRTPNKVELGLFSAMWSEHCSYKSSRAHLGKMPSTGERVILGPGENAGVVDVGDGWGVCFKVESHNHPSFIEPYQGAATGVGGILRDVFTMGARPILAANLLRFGQADHAKTPQLLDGVVRGIGGYGNCFGVPTVYSDVAFHESYNGNILVNALALGIVRNDSIFLGRAEGVGRPLYYVGAKTGRDGIHGATMASDSFSEEKEAERPTVQVGDPFKEKVLLEACLESFAAGVLTGIQDMGAAGLTSSSFEMASRAGSGIILDLDKVPTREEAMTAYEIMLSESQERMLLVAAPGREDDLQAIWAKWGLDCVPIGEVTDDGMVRLRHGGAEVAVVPARELADEAPKYERPYTVADPVVEGSEDIEVDLERALRELAADPSLADRSWVYRQYDREVGAGTLADARGAAAAVVEDPRAGKRIALALVADHELGQRDAFEGGRRSLFEGALRVASVGGTPIGATDCLNYGNPQVPEVMGELVRGIEGIADACRELSVPIVSGNVSLYNETDGRQVAPTPSVGVVGGEVPASFARLAPRAGDAAFLLGERSTTVAGSRVARRAGDPRACPRWSGAAVRELVDALVSAKASAARPATSGGVLMAVLEMCLAGDVGFVLDGAADVAFLVGESAPAAVVAGGDATGEPIGRFEGSDVVIGDVSIPLSELRAAWRSAIPRIAGEST
jgi:phosphoribosylformylglycinamidine synthase